MWEVFPSIDQMKVVWSYTDLWFLAFFGVFILYILNNLNDKKPFSLLIAMKVNMTSPVRPMIILLDMIISSAIGAIIVHVVTDPATYQEAFATGMGLTGILSSFSKQA